MPENPFKGEEVITVTTIDTIYIETIIRDTIPKIKYSYIYKIEKDTIYNEGVPVVVDIPISKYLYSNKVENDSTTIEYDAYLTGYKATLDSIDFSIKYKQFNTTIDNTITKKENRLSIGVQVGTGYGLFTKKPDVFIGIGISYKLK